MLCSPDELLGNAREPLGSAQGSQVIPGSPCSPQAGAGGTNALLSLGRGFGGCGREGRSPCSPGSDFLLLRLN